MSVKNIFKHLKMIIDEYQEDKIAEIYIFQEIYVLIHGVISFYFYITKNYYMALKYSCRAKRIFEKRSEKSIASKIYSKIFKKLFFNSNDRKLIPISENIIIKDFLKTKEYNFITKKFYQYDLSHIVSLKYPKINDDPYRQGNLLILKKYSKKMNEKGVIYLKFNESFKQFIALFNISKIAENYIIVLEPSTWGYMEEDFHLFIGQGLDVVIQAQDENDYNFIKKLDVNLIPIRLGAGDWIDTSVFNESKIINKKYDIIMIASWSKVKRHKVLFKAIYDEGLKNIKVALVGYAWDGRDLQDIKKEASKYRVLENIDFYENIKSEEVSNIIKNSKIGVMLTKREGANRGIYECLLSGVPIIVYKRNKGVNKAIINKNTGMLVEDKDLGSTIRSMINEINKYSCVAKWAKENIGIDLAYRKLNETIKNLSIKNKESYSVQICKIRPGHFAYINQCDRAKMTDEYITLRKYLRRTKL